MRAFGGSETDLKIRSLGEAVPGWGGLFLHRSRVIAPSISRTCSFGQLFGRCVAGG